MSAASDRGTEQGAVVDPTHGLTSEEVARRVADGQVNDLPPRSGRSVGDIVRANVFTRINLILGILLAVALSTGSLKNCLFGLLIIANSGIGIIQEVRAKKTLDALAIVGETRPVVRRDGTAREIDRRELVLDDILEIGPGDQVPVDGEVVEAGALEVDESMLTGENDPVVKTPGSQVLSGSFVVSGSGAYRATAVGRDAYAAQLAEEASRFTLVRSELRSGIDSILKFIGFLLIPTGLLTIWVQLFRVGSGTREAILGMVAALVPMVPEGLVLMTSVAFAVGVVRLGQRDCLVQELPAIEGLARVDVVCADKTGTLTENGMRLAEVVPLEGHDETEALGLLRRLAATDPRPNASMAAVLEHVGECSASERAEAGETTGIQPFTSALKWSGASFASGANIVLGAPDVLAEAGSVAAARADEIGSTGLRVLLLGLCERGVDCEGAPGRVDPVALVVLEQRVRPDAADTVAYFHRQNVEVKVISGDNAVSVGAVTEPLGIGHGTSPVDARKLPPGESEQFAETVNGHGIFGRVSPQQKRDMVKALQGRGHTVAMTGDGVNDVLALKDADIGVAMGSGSEASRAVAQIVLLDNKFATLPHVVGEGRRVIGNIERIATLFLTKTVYSVLLALLVGIFALPFPFVPIHVTITAWFTIGIPAFLLSLAPNNERARTGFVKRVMTRAVPSGVIIGVASFVTYLVARDQQTRGLASDVQVSTAVLVVVIAIALFVLALVARPYKPWKVALVVISALAYIVMFTAPALADFFSLDVGSEPAMRAALVASVVGIGLVAPGWLLSERRLLAEKREHDAAGEAAPAGPADLKG